MFEARSVWWISACMFTRRWTSAGGTELAAKAAIASAAADGDGVPTGSDAPASLVVAVDIVCRAHNSVYSIIDNMNYAVHFLPSPACAAD